MSVLVVGFETCHQLHFKVDANHLTYISWTVRCPFTKISGNLLRIECISKLSQLRCQSSFYVSKAVVMESVQCNFYIFSGRYVTI